jgi:GEVED domain/Secretion system C-terminal sorting domain
MKKLYLLLHLVAASLLLSSSAKSQCSGGYPVAAQLNWDNLDYYYNSGSNVAPYGFSTPSNGNYINNAKEQTQRFAVGKNAVSIVTSAAGMVRGENGVHTGNLVNYAGDDAQYTPSAVNQTITLTFDSPVSSPNFTLYDIDRSAQLTVTATNNLGLPTAVNVATQPGTILTIGILPLVRTITASSSTEGSASVLGAATINVPGPVNTITITVNTLGSDAVFYMSDLNACVATNFTANWHQLANNRPFVGPTQNMPDYFLVTPDNNSVYMVDAATAAARWLFTDADRDYVNSFGYDPYNRFLYYISEDVAVDYTNKQIKRYDYNTETSSILVADVTAAPLNIPTFNSGIESAGCAFYDGSLYFGIEGGTHSTGGGSPVITTRETIIFRIDFDGSNNPIRATQVFAANASTSGSGTQTSIHDWGDFIIKNGVIYDFNTARNSSNYSQSKYHHYNMNTGAVTIYNNPGTASWNGQSGMTWAQSLYYFRASTGTSSVIGTYNEAGTNGATQTIAFSGPGPAWPGGAGDASDPFRPKCDFGDAPATYDPYANPAIESPAVHERADSMWIGNTTSEATSWSREYLKRGVSGTEDTDNGISTVPFLQPGGPFHFLAQVSLYNNSSGNATVMAWLDFNGNGVFDAAEAAQIVPAGPITPSASVQSRYLYWPSITTPLLSGSSTYLRVRITSAAAGMTGSHPTGYFAKGEVEDYRVPVDDYPLATQLLDFKALLNDNKQVKLNWKTTEDATVYAYEVEKSIDNINWSGVATVKATGSTGTFQYEHLDNNPLKGVSYYRIKIIESTGMSRFSPVKKIIFDEFIATLAIAPNPASRETKLLIEANEASEVFIRVLTIEGKELMTKRNAIVSGSNSIELVLPSNIPSGVYMVRATVGNKTIQQKLIINR